MGNMNGLVVVAACVCATSAQVLVGGYAGAINPAPSTQFHAQDEFGQFSFGHAGGPSARTEARNAYGVTTGSYQYIDANGLLQTVNYVADPVNGFQVAGTNLPVGPAAPAVEPLDAPVFDLPLPVAPEDTSEVAEAKAAHAAALEAAAAAASERKRRDADEEAAPAVDALPLGYAGLAGLPYTGLPLAAGLPLTYGAAPVAALPAASAVAYTPVVKSVEEKPAEVATEITAHPVLSYGAPFLYGKRSADEEAAAAPAPAVAALPFPYAAGLPFAGYPYAAGLPYAAAPSREAVLTTIKLNPGHAVAYRVD